MEVLVMRNGQMGISFFESGGNPNPSYGWKPFSSRGFSNCCRPIFGVPFNHWNRKRMRAFGLRTKALSKGVSDNGLVGGTLVEKECEFKPSFNEYLKAMESVTAVRKKRQLDRSGGNNLKDNSRQSTTPSLPRNEGNVKLRRFSRFSDQGNTSKQKHNDEFEVNNGGKIGAEDVFSGECDSEEMGTGDLHDNSFSKEIGAEASLSPMLRINETKNTQYARESAVVSNVEGNASTMGIQKDLAWKKGEVSPFKVVENGVRSNQSSHRLVGARSSEDTDNKNVKKNNLLTISNQSFHDSVDFDEGLEVERAAFKSFEELDGATVRTPVSKREMEERIQKLAKQLNGADINMPEWMFSKMIRSARIKFTDHSILRIIQLLGKLGNWRRVLQVIEWLQMRERFKSNRLRNVYTTALDVLGKARRPVEALNIFLAMQEQMSTYPDLVAYHSIAVTLGQAGHIKELFDVIDSMRSPPKKKFKTGALPKWDPRLEPDIVVYNAVLNACVRQKQWEGAFWVLQQLKLVGLKPSTATYGLIMEVMFVCGKYNLVYEFFRRMQKSYIPNALAYKVCVNSLWKEGKTDEAVLAVQDMERRGIVGSAALYYDLARCLCSAGRCEEALVQIEKISKVASKPLVVTYTGLIQSCLDSGNIQNAMYIFNQMKQFCSPNLVTFNILLKAYIEHGLFEEAKELFNKMSEDADRISSIHDHKFRVIPDIYTFNTMLDACVAQNRWDDFEYIYGLMFRYGNHFNAKRHLRMILDALRAGKGEPMEITWKHLARERRAPPPPLIKERFCWMLEKEDYESALASCVTANLTGELQAFSRAAWLNLLNKNSQRFRKDTIIQVMHEATTLVARTKQANSILQNLLSSCNDFLSRS